jgi:hypothetical protein
VFYCPMCTFLLNCYVCFIVQYVILLSCMSVLLVLCLFFVLYGFSVPCYCIVCFVFSFVFFVLVY